MYHGDRGCLFIISYIYDKLCLIGRGYVSIGGRDDWVGTSERDCFPDPSSSISDQSEIGQTGTANSLLCLAVLKRSQGWREFEGPYRGQKKIDISKI